jgi:hypothetical protein
MSDEHDDANTSLGKFTEGSSTHTPLRQPAEGGVDWQPVVVISLAPHDEGPPENVCIGLGDLTADLDATANLLIQIGSDALSRITGGRGDVEAAQQLLMGQMLPTRIVDGELSLALDALGQDRVLVADVEVDESLPAFTLRLADGSSLAIGTEVVARLTGNSEDWLRREPMKVAKQLGGLRGSEVPLRIGPRPELDLERLVGELTAQGKVMEAPRKKAPCISCGTWVSAGEPIRWLDAVGAVVACPACEPDIRAAGEEPSNVVPISERRGKKIRQPANKREATGPKGARIQPGMRVRAGDRDNFGEVMTVDEDRAVVHFRNPKTGAVATPTLELELLTPVSEQELEAESALAEAASRLEYAGVPVAEVTDSQDAIRFANATKEVVRYVRDSTRKAKDWALWDGTRWERVGQIPIKKRVMDFWFGARKEAERLAAEARECAARAAAEGDDAGVAAASAEAEAWKGFQEHANKRLNKHGIEAILSIVPSCDVLWVVEGVFDGPGTQMLLNVLNGTVDLKTGQLRAHDPKDYITLRLELDFDPDALCPRWDQLLAEAFEGDESLVAFMDRMYGYALTALTSEEKMAILYDYGLGGTGKNTQLNTVHQLLGPYARNVEPSTFAENSKETIRSDIMRLEAPRLLRRLIYLSPATKAGLC